MPLLRLLLYFALLLTSTITLIARPYLIETIRDGQIDPMWILAGPILFTLFFITYMVDQIRRGKLAILSILFGLALMVFLFPTSFREYQARRTPTINTQAFFDTLLHSPDARIRTLVLMASSCQLNSNQDWAFFVEKGLSDSDPMVQEAAKQAISQKLGVQFSDDDAGLARAKNTLRDWSASL